MTTTRDDYDVDNFDLIEKISENRISRVYKTKLKTESDGTFYILKVFHNISAGIFMVEEQATFDMKNIPHTIQYLNSDRVILNEPDGEESGYFLVSEYFDGKNIEEAYIPRDKWIPLFINIIDTITAIHKKKWNHRDIKGGNVLYQESTGDFMIIDMGAAQARKKAKKFMIDASSSMTGSTYSSTGSGDDYVQIGDNDSVDGRCLGQMMYNICNVTPNERSHVEKSHCEIEFLDTLIDNLCSGNINIDEAKDILVNNLPQ